MPLAIENKQSKVVVVVVVVVVTEAFSRLRGSWENVRLFIPSQHIFFFKVEISSCTLIPLFMPGTVHSGSASRDDCGSVFRDELHVSSFPAKFPHYAWTAA